MKRFTAIGLVVMRGLFLTAHAALARGPVFRPALSDEEVGK